MESFNFWGICFRSLPLVLLLALPGLGRGQTPALAPEKAAVQENEFRVRLKAAARLYEELEYEQALNALSEVKQLAKSADEQAEVAVYEGIVLADLGQRPKALKSFREALSLQPDTRLPVKVSPKVARDFEEVRQAVRNERGALARAKPPASQRTPVPQPPAATTDRPAQPLEDPPALVTTPVPGRHEPAPGVADLGTPQLSEKRRLQTLPLALMGAGVVAGGVGSYFGLRSQGNIQDARESADINKQLIHLDTARGQALAANILFGVAVTAAAGAVITYFTGNEPAHAKEVSP